MNGEGRTGDAEALNVGALLRGVDPDHRDLLLGRRREPQRHCLEHAELVLVEGVHLVEQADDADPARAEVRDAGALSVLHLLHLRGLVERRVGAHVFEVLPGLLVAVARPATILSPTHPLGVSGPARGFGAHLILSQRCRPA
jgi:hypothetical protein